MWAAPPWNSLLLLALATGPSSTESGARAERPPRTTTWRAPPPCPSHEEIRAELEQWTGPSGDARSGAGVSAEVIIERAPEGFTMELIVRRPGDAAPERRSLAHADCRLLTRAAVLILITLDDPVEVVTQSRPPPPVAPPAPLVERPLPPAPPPPMQGLARADTAVVTRSRPPRRHDVRGVLGAVVGPVWGLVPTSSTTVGGSIGLRHGALGIDAVGWHVLAAERELRPGVGIRAELSGADVDLLFSLPLGSAALSLHLGTTLGVLRGRGTGSRVQGERTQGLWVGGTAGAAVTWPADRRLALSARAQATASFLRPGIHLSDQARPIEVFRVPPTGASMLLGPQLRFP